MYLGILRNNLNMYHYSLQKILSLNLYRKHSENKSIFKKDEELSPIECFTEECRNPKHSRINTSTQKKRKWFRHSLCDCSRLDCDKLNRIKKHIQSVHEIKAVDTELVCTIIC